MVRKAKAKDIDQIFELINKNLDHLQPRTKTQLRNALGMLWVAEVDKKIVGCCMLDIYSKRLAELRTLAVHADYRGQGFSKKLVSEANKAAHEFGIQEVIVFTSRPEVFEKLGYATTPKTRFAMFLAKVEEDE